jgi:hypothetical protein
MWRPVTSRRAAVAEVAAGRVPAIVTRRPVPWRPVTSRRATVAEVAAGRAAVLPRRAAVASVGWVAEVPLAPFDVVAPVKVARVAPVKVPLTKAATTTRRWPALIEVARTGRGWVPKLPVTRRVAIAQLTATRRHVPLAQVLSQVARRWAVAWRAAWEQADVDGLLLAVISGLQLVRDALVWHERGVCTRTGSRLTVARRSGGGVAAARVPFAPGLMPEWCAKTSMLSSSGMMKP